MAKKDRGVGRKLVRALGNTDFQPARTANGEFGEKKKRDSV